MGALVAGTARLLAVGGATPRWPRGPRRRPGARARRERGRGGEPGTWGRGLRGIPALAFAAPLASSVWEEEGGRSRSRQHPPELQPLEREQGVGRGRTEAVRGQLRPRGRTGRSPPPPALPPLADFPSTAQGFALLIN